MHCYVNILVSDLETRYTLSSTVDPHIICVFILMTTGDPTSLLTMAILFFFDHRTFEEVKKFNVRLSLLEQGFF